MGASTSAFGEVIAVIVTSPLFWIVTLLAAAVFILRSLYVRLKIRALGRMEYIRSFSSDGVFAGESFELKETLRNTTMFPLFFVKMEFYVPSGLTVDGIRCEKHTKVTSIFHVPPFSSATKRHEFCANARGKYSLVNTAAVYKHNEFVFEYPFELYVYPSYKAASELGYERLYTVGDTISSKKYREDPFFISGIRPYTATDPPSSINYKASARCFRGGARELLCNSYDSSRDYDTMIFLDVYARSEHGRAIDDEALFENGLSMSCRIAVDAVRAGGTVGFAVNCSVGSKNYFYAPVSSGETHVRELLRGFAQFSPFSARVCSIESLISRVAPTLGRKTDVYLIAYGVDTATAELLRRLERMGRTVTVIPLTDGGRQDDGN